MDFETTGTDPTKDEIIEVAAVRFRYSNADEITGVSDTFQAFNEPSTPIPAEITELTGITDAMVAGHKIDAEALQTFVSDANVIIAHHAEFDRKFAEFSWPLFAQKYWACSMAEIEWQKKLGFAGTKLGYLLAGAGYFHGAHRAIDDCQAVLELLARQLPGWAENSPYDLKDALKCRGYRWNDGTDGRPRSWHIDVGKDNRDAELNYLKKEIYQRDVDVLCRELTARERFSNRA